MKTLRTLIALLLACVAGSAIAAGDDLAACRYGNGRAIEPQVCEVLQQHAAADQAKATRQAAELQRLQAEDAQAQATRQAAAAGEEQRVQVAATEQAAAQRALSEQLARTQAEDEANDARAEATRMARRGECGADYGRPHVGMSMDRARQCVGDFRLVSQVNRADGVVSVYRAGRLMVHEMGGRIAAWSVY